MSARPLASAPTPGANTVRHAAILQRFSEAWARGDVDALMDLMSDDPIYRSSTGPGPGAVYRGREAVGAAFTRLLAPSPVADDAPLPPPGDVAFFDNRALSFWSLPARSPDGTPSVVEGVDVLTFAADGRIAVKDAYRKAWPA